MTASSIDCALCLSEICNPNNELETLKLECGHRFHGSCIAQWFRQSITCPLCRRTKFKPQFEAMQTELDNLDISVSELKTDIMHLQAEQRRLKKVRAEEKLKLYLLQNIQEFEDDMPAHGCPLSLLWGKRAIEPEPQAHLTY
ncbi:MAG TPA: RING finger domain-containing protein [Oculatellaceae cyanobacterium]